MAMLPAKRKIVINAPINYVFSYLADFSLHGRWDGAPGLGVDHLWGTCKWVTPPPWCCCRLASPYWSAIAPAFSVRLEVRWYDIL